MYGSEVTWRGQRSVSETVQRSVNRMARASLGVFGSTPVSFLQSFGGSMPAVQRLNQRQAAFAARTVCSTHPSTRQIASGTTPLATRLKAAIGIGEQGDRRVGGKKRVLFERIGASRALRFPGKVDIPSSGGDSEEEKVARNARAVAFAREFQEDPWTLWTDGSCFGKGGCASAVVWYEGECGERGESDRDVQHVIERRGTIG